jgi:hypothetical protein
MEHSVLSIVVAPMKLAVFCSDQCCQLKSLNGSDWGIQAVVFFSIW